ncbi:hemolymph lipopolysaccharide-binding protein-like [Chrysoperla carnea]|uniref:hemolymph lipopolysaccharide-binding protein-like n=1 Tax=Chrysoperla carnea TaxID=189513 RepID=UPI001D07B0F5|nr:hemolymph lipopolysaccharide-binding protein-like [Chrysoperla carnea]
MVTIRVFVTLILWLLKGHAVNGLAINETILETNSNATHLEPTSSNNNNLLLRLGNSCYKFHTDPQIWNEARKICISEGGYLAILNTDQEAQYLAALLNGLYPESSLDDSIPDKYWTFIGFHAYFQKGEYVTIDGLNIESSGFNHFSPGEPNNPGVENCGTIGRNGLLNDYFCDRKSIYICEIPAKQ